MSDERTEKVFADGLIFKDPSENAPDWIVGRIWIKVADFKAWLDEHNTNNGGVNIDIKRSKNGNVYCELSTWKPEKPKGLENATSEQDEVTSEEDSDTGIPF